MKLPLFQIIETMAQRIDSCAVGFSGGKDSIVTLDLCCKHFKTVKCFFWYLVKGLEFQEQALRWAESKYNIEIIRQPHFGLCNLLREGSFRHCEETTITRKVVQRDLEAAFRETHNLEWIAYGMKANDSFRRRAMILGEGKLGIDEKTKRFYPVATWSDKQVVCYTRQHNLFNPLRVNRSGWGSLTASNTVWLYNTFPEDYERVKRVFPFIEANIARWKLGYIEVPDFPLPGAKQESDKGS